MLPGRPCFALAARCAAACPSACAYRCLIPLRGLPATPLHKPLQEALRNIADTTAENVRDCASGGTLRNEVLPRK